MLKILIIAVVTGVIAGAAPSTAQRPAGPVGYCRFSPDTLRFAGTPQQQAACLLRKIRQRGSGADPQAIPPALLDRVGQRVTIDPAALIRFLATSHIPGEQLGGPILAGDAPQRAYFVIHDTSSPEIAAPGTFPANMDSVDYSGNRLWPRTDTAKRVHMIISRDGRSRAFRDWKDGHPLPGLKLEMNSVLPAAQVAFVQVENVQPRIRPAGSWAWKAPQPGFSPPQRDRLALAYIVASVRAGRWLIPAFHFNVDQDGPGGTPHDDPQNFDLTDWVAAIVRVEAAIIGIAPAPAPAPDTMPMPTPATASGASWPTWIDLSRTSDIAEGYRAEFGQCDTNSRFRGYALPATIGTRRYNSCTTDQNRVTALRTLGATPELPRGVVLFTSKLSVDLDGSWFACHTPGYNDQCATSLPLRNAAGVQEPISSDSVAYVVMPTAGPTSALSSEFARTTKIGLGDFGVVIAGDRVIPVMVADGGPFNKLGEGSIALHRAFGHEICLTKDSVGRCVTIIGALGSLPGPFVTIIAPGSKRSDVRQENVVQIVRQEGDRIWAAARGRLGR